MTEKQEKKTRISKKVCKSLQTICKKLQQFPEILTILWQCGIKEP